MSKLIADLGILCFCAGIVSAVAYVLGGGHPLDLIPLPW